MSVNTQLNEPISTLRIISYNVQVGIHTRKRGDYILGGWKHLLPHTQRLTNLDKIAHFFSDYDLVGLQEVDAGSIRSGFINLIEYLAYRAELPNWYHQVNRNLGRIAQHSNGLLSRYKPDAIENLKLPGLIPGRQGLLARFDSGEDTLVVIVLHLALGKRARLKQLDYIADIINDYPHAIVMGDLNCRAHSPEMQHLFRKTDLHEPLETLHTYPSWQPMYNIDHILVSSKLKVIKAAVVDHPVSDHLPIMMEISLPPGLILKEQIPHILPHQADLSV
jgi:endonuclease/exonuclease/phosphatase family metal-dependent hydrolase